MARDRNDAPVVPTETSYPAAPDQYDVLVSFTDPDDKTAPNGANVYWAGKNLYPRKGYTPPEERIAYLQSDKNALKRPVISGRAKK